MARRRYTDDERAEACVELEAAGYPDKKGALQITSKKLGIPQTTLHQWFHGKNNPPPSQLRCEKKREFREGVKDACFELLESMSSARKDADLQALGVTFGILVDKYQLLGNDPTQIINLNNLNDEQLETLHELMEIAGG